MLSYGVSVPSESRVVLTVTISAQKRCPVRLYLQQFVGGLMPQLRYLCLLVYSGVQHILCCVFRFVSSSCVPYMLPVCLDCSFFIAPSVSANLYLFD